MEQLKQILMEINDQIDYAVETELLSAGLLDSVQLVELVAALEEEYGIEIPLDEIEPDNFDSIEAIFNMIQRVKQ